MSVRGFISGRTVVAVGLAVAALFCALFAFSSSAHAIAETEANDTRETAQGPLFGGTDYTGAFQTENDDDWFVFYIKTYGQMDFSATTNCTAWHELELNFTDKDGNSIASLEAGITNVRNHLYLTMNPGRYYVEAENYSGECTKDTYSFRIDPAAAITASRVCGEAIVARDSVAIPLADVSAKIAKNGEALAKVEALVQQRKATLAKLRRQWRAPRWRKRRAREKLDASKAAQEKVEVKRIGLQTLGAQYTATVNQANAQIAVSC